MEENACGLELSEAAGVPASLALLMDHVAENLTAHATWVGTASDSAAAENTALLQLAFEYRAIASAARQAASTMRGMAGLRAAPHDPERWDKATFAMWLERKVSLQTALGEVLLEHARAAQRHLDADA